MQLRENFAEPTGVNPMSKGVWDRQGILSSLLRNVLPESAKWVIISKPSSHPGVTVRGCVTYTLDSEFWRFTAKGATSADSLSHPDIGKAPTSAIPIFL